MIRRGAISLLLAENLLFSLAALTLSMSHFHTLRALRHALDEFAGLTELCDAHFTGFGSQQIQLDRS